MQGDFDDTLEDFGVARQPVNRAPESYKPILERAFTEPCAKCRGSGRFVSYSGRTVGPCFTCKGTGTKTFKSAPDVRAKARQASAERKQAARDEYAAEHKAELDWLADTAARQIERRNTGKTVWQFPIDLCDKLAQYGSLTDGQLAAVRKAMVRDADRKAQWEANKPAPTAIDASKLTAAFAKRRAAKRERAVGVAYMRLQIGAITISPDKSNNVDVWFKSGDAWLGKTENGAFKRFRACTDAHEADIRRICADPGQAARMHGLDYSYCACCGLPLTNAESIERGIGPICAENWGF